MSETEDVRVVISSRELTLVPVDADVTTIPLSTLDGVTARESHATLFVAGGKVIDLDGVDAGELLGAVFALPELTRALRAFGSARARPGADHDRFFAPLIEPLRRARVAHERALASADAPWSVAEFFDVAVASKALRETLMQLAGERFATPGPDRRALEAELLDESEEVFDALASLAAARQVLATASDETRASAWRAWSDALGTVFRAADRAWSRSLPALAGR